MLPLLLCCKKLQDTEPDSCCWCMWMFTAGLGYDYESPLAVSPIQKWLTLNTAEVVLTDIQPATWNFIQDVLVLMAKKIGYKPFYPEYRTKRQSALNQEEEEDEEEEEEEKE